MAKLVLLVTTIVLASGCGSAATTDTVAPSETSADSDVAAALPVAAMGYLGDEIIWISSGDDGTSVFARTARDGGLVDPEATRVVAKLELDAPRMLVVGDRIVVSGQITSSCGTECEQQRFELHELTASGELVRKSQLGAPTRALTSTGAPKIIGETATALYATGDGLLFEISPEGTVTEYPVPTGLECIVDDELIYYEIEMPDRVTASSIRNGQPDAPRTIEFNIPDSGTWICADNRMISLTGPNETDVAGSLTRDASLPATDGFGSGIQTTVTANLDSNLFRLTADGEVQVLEESTWVRTDVRFDLPEVQPPLTTPIVSFAAALHGDQVIACASGGTAPQPGEPAGHLSLSECRVGGIA